MQKLTMKKYINKKIYDFKNDCNLKYIEPSFLTAELGCADNDVVSILDTMTNHVEPYYIITCPDCCNEIAIIKNIPTKDTIYVCNCSVKFELKLKHISLVYKIK